MKIGIESSAYPITPEGLAKMKRHGYHCMDYQAFTSTPAALFERGMASFEQAVLRDTEIIAASGIEVSQAHGPWRYPPRDVEPEDRAERFDKMAMTLHGTRLLNCRYMVVHPMMPYGCGKPDDTDRFFEINYDHYRRLCQVAEQENVIICLENMPMPELPLATPSQILAFVREINSPFLRVCLDTGHCAVCGVSAGDAVRELGAEFLHTLHVHDNDGTRDLHQLPYFGVTDWEDFARALQEIGFDKTVSLECRIRSSIPEPACERFETGLAGMARHLAGLDR